MGDLLDLPPIDETMGDEPQKTAVALAVGQAIDLEKVDLEKLALAQFGDWRKTTDKLKADYLALVMDLSTQSKIDEAKSLRERTINKPLAEARRVAKALKSKLNTTSKAVGTELEAIESAYDGAAAPLTKLIDGAQKKLDDEKEAKRLAEENRLAGLRARVDEIMAAWVARCQIEGMTAERVNAGIAGLQAVVMPPDFADVTAYWSTSKTATVATMQQIHDQLERARLAKLKQLIDGATEQIKAIQQQPIIAHQGRLGVRQGGTIECIRETLAETEAWPIDEATFGPLMPAAQIAKDGAIAAIKAMLAERLQRDAARKAEQAAMKYPSGAPMFGSAIKENGDRIMLNEQGGRSIFCDVDEDAPAAALAQQETTPPADAGGTPPDVAAGADAAPMAAGEAENPGQEPEAAPITGNPPGMLQNDSRGLSQALASKPDAMLHAREAAAAIADDHGPLETGESDAIVPPPAPDPAPEAPTIKLGSICAEVGTGFTVTAEFVRGLGFEHDGREKAAMLYTPTKRRQILLALAKRLQEIA